VLDVLIMWFFVNIVSFKDLLLKLLSYVNLTFNDLDTQDKIYYWFVKIFISAVLVTIANYVFSKFLIFNKKKKNKTDAEEGEAENKESKK